MKVMKIQCIIKTEGLTGKIQVKYVSLDIKTSHSDTEHNMVRLWHNEVLALTSWQF